MKQFVLSLLLLSVSLFSFSQSPSPTPCASTFSVLKNGAGAACASTFDGNGVDAANTAYRKDGIVQIRFLGSLGEGVTPVITAIREITSPAGQLPITRGDDLDMKFDFRQVTPGTSNMAVEYCFYSKTNLNLNNASWARYQVDITYVIGGVVTTASCDIRQFDPSTLAVELSAFAAVRSSAASVRLSWTTLSEENAKGFYVQKSTGSAWKTVAFVPSQAAGGSSTAALSYSYTDGGTERGTIQYRLQQVDLDGTVSYSDIRAIKGEGSSQGKVSLYPNPTTTGGGVSVVFDNPSAHDVAVVDLQGRVVKSYTNVTTARLAIDGLQKGLYMVKVTSPFNNTPALQKLIVQ